MQNIAKYAIAFTNLHFYITIYTFIWNMECHGIKYFIDKNLDKFSINIVQI